MKAILLSVLLLISAARVPAAKPNDVPRATVAELTRQLESTVIEKVNYREATIPEIAEHLVKQSKDLDPNKAGFTITLTPAAKNAQARITLSLSNVPMIEVIKYITNLADLKYRLEKDNVVVFDALKN
jgi:general secretion pathway protein D